APGQRGGEIDEQHRSPMAPQGAERDGRPDERNQREQGGGQGKRDQDDRKRIDVLEDMAEIDVAERLRQTEKQDQAGAYPGPRQSARWFRPRWFRQGVLRCWTVHGDKVPTG